MPKRIAITFLALASLSTEPALANVPDPNRSIVPTWILLVGELQGGAADPRGAASLQVWDFANPEGGCRVRLDFSACCDLRLCGAILNGVRVDAVDGVVEGTADGNGVVSFVILGAATAVGDCGPDCSLPGFWTGCARVLANSGTGWVDLRHPAVVALDQDGAAAIGGSAGVSGADISWVIHHFGVQAVTGPAGYRARSDLNQDGTLSGADVSEAVFHLGRLALVGGVGCTTAYSAVPACP